MRSTPAGPPAATTASAAGARGWLARAGMYFIGVYLIGKMFYVLGGGAAQPADFALAGVAVFLSPPRALGRAAREQILLTMLIAWIVSVNVGWSLLTGQPDFLVSSAYYLFNFLIVAAIFGVRERDPEAFDRIVTTFLRVSIAIQFAMVVVRGGHSLGARSHGSFENPNQLSYWCVCALSILLVLRRNRTRPGDIPFLVMALWCQLASASRAGLGATLLLLMIWGWFALRDPLKRLIGGMLALLLVLAVAAAPTLRSEANGSATLSTVTGRLTREETTSEWDVRNYSRIVDHYIYVVLGAGEGQLSRFSDDDGDATLEIHSTFGTLLFAYGVVGLALFCLFLLWLAIRLPAGIAVYLAPAIVYGLTHQGLRFSFFWILVGILAQMISARRTGAAEPSSRRDPAGEIESASRVPHRRDRDFLLAAARLRGAR